MTNQENTVGQQIYMEIFQRDPRLLSIFKISESSVENTILLENDVIKQRAEGLISMLDSIINAKNENLILELCYTVGKSFALMVNSDEEARLFECCYLETFNEVVSEQIVKATANLSCYDAKAIEYSWNLLVSRLQTQLTLAYYPERLKQREIREFWIIQQAISVPNYIESIPLDS